MLRKIFLVFAVTLFSLAANPPPKPSTVTFDVLLGSAHSAVLGRPEGPCRILLVLTTEDFPLTAPSKIVGEFKSNGLYLSGKAVTVEQFVVIEAPACQAPPPGAKAL